jgi:predicted CopG family antitoxin
MCMSTKTLSVDLEAYERLSRARKYPRESFSQVIRRAIWAESAKSGKRILELMASTEPATEDVITRLEEVQARDTPPADPWTRF